ncbi:MAG: leucine-rich repeat domain-containing protein [Bacteroidales bacterium]|nr:leucine-rich repeat domain-containing protein [Bacteroidales bacterium]
MKRIINTIALCLALAASVQAQNDKWFDKNGKILPQYLDEETGLLADEYLPDAHEFTSMEEALAVPERVIKLNLSNQDLTEFPPEVFMFPNIQVLDLQQNRITEIPSRISELPTLQYLTLNSNEISSVAPEIGALKNLLMLDLEQNKLTSLPD